MVVSCAVRERRHVKHGVFGTLGLLCTVSLLRAVVVLGLACLGTNTTQPIKSLCPFLIQRIYLLRVTVIKPADPLFDSRYTISHLEHPGIGTRNRRWPGPGPVSNTLLVSNPNYRVGDLIGLNRRRMQQ
ncbi:hypothetical protein BT67DRAFT_43424 [Trichocladium antarcticum]|uniref:Uncharacterized protein n=1 Tax=Trichocladium antarcticum TaxID=1450529 RepID=A0AAN6UIZ7_9PEZI|nr:hypothetical protein BT67DRAFT_43424 [Trichocladium antarcticum]